jgi:hypothetical protein
MIYLFFIINLIIYWNDGIRRKLLIGYYFYIKKFISFKTYIAFKM